MLLFLTILTVFHLLSLSESSTDSVSLKSDCAFICLVLSLSNSVYHSIIII